MSSIITPSDLNAFTQKKLNSALASQVVAAVNAYVERVTHRCWGENKSVTERHDWNRSVWLRHQDVISITSVKTGYPGHDQDTYDSGGYHVNPLGRLSFYSSPWGPVPG